MNPLLELLRAHAARCAEEYGTVVEIRPPLTVIPGGGETTPRFVHHLNLVVEGE